MYEFKALAPVHWMEIPEEARPRRCEDTRGIVALKEGKLVAACVLDSWTENSCQIHIHIEDPFVLKHGFAEEVFSYVFSEDSGRKVIIGVTPADNARALKFITHMGFEEVGRIPDGFKDGVDYVLTTMRREECEWTRAAGAS